VQVATARDVGLAVRGRRLDRGWSQEQLASRAGTSRKWISQLEQGKPSVELALLLQTLAALDLVLEVSDASGADHDLAASALVDLDEVLARFDEGQGP
jgi:HTH-type transcriptional regulator / antitoxin HipB